jgi:hypothetical protein
MRENREQAIPETGGNNNPLPLPEGHTKENPQDNDKKFNYIEYYLNIVQRLGGDNPKNLMLAVEITDKQMGVVQQTVPLNRSQKPLATRPPKKAPRVFDGKMKSEFSSSKEEVETYFTYYEFEFDREEDKISWVEDVLTDKALRWHQRESVN